MPNPHAPSCLIVEDEALIAIDLEATFEAAGWCVYGPFARSSEALLVLPLVRPTLAVIDLLLSDGPSQALIDGLRRQGVPIVLFSGTAPGSIAATLRELPLVQKPSPPAAVLALAERMLAGPAPAPAHA